ncbi:hypothetical protein VNO78_20304 [Psophocarpus tetragonolobus]|uniref:Uncharacterized protein n=1 Tax=Psophocarpus tetragonolobus TaxID=3891 RepID=A0AAN9XH31_PSOTE
MGDKRVAPEMGVKAVAGGSCRMEEWIESNGREWTFYIEAAVEDREDMESDHIDDLKVTINECNFHNGEIRDIMAGKILMATNLGNNGIGHCEIITEEHELEISVGKNVKDHLHGSSGKVEGCVVRKMETKALAGLEGHVGLELNGSPDKQIGGQLFLCDTAGPIAMVGETDATLGGPKCRVPCFSWGHKQHQRCWGGRDLYSRWISPCWIWLRMVTNLCS